MASQFDRWEKDPFFSAAEEVQESADRMESTYRTWIHSMKDSSSMWNSEELRRDLRTALGTTKWQLEEFERAVKFSYSNSLDDDPKERHRQFITAIECQVSKIKSSLHESAISDGKPHMPWVRLDERECHELALFLSGPSIRADKVPTEIHVKAELSASPQEIDKQSAHEHSENSRHAVEWNVGEAMGEKLPGHCRTESGCLKIAVADDVFPHISSNGPSMPPPRKIPSISGLLGSMEIASKLKCSRNGYSKLKNMDHPLEVDSTLSQSQQLTRGINACYERSKSCLDGSSGSDECYDKQLYGWYGALQRLLQRSQYQMQYNRPIQMVLWTVLCFIVLFAMR
ncbi:uncharacterized protein LOC130776596 [Actinidia eriantha]|uniref:uncharacterized protein LOC130776596 n=1 Tax=Actinidia eriantha TaxID=165200 RepID=UPI002583C6CE|nr:uncharacterized protein LOC130776596 [Actinidia eriantha]